jgi:adenylate/nucleoside-diphosphate kinase
MASNFELDQFLMSPSKFVPPKAPYTLPSQEVLPQKRSYADVKALFPKQVELQGFCPVSYVDGKYRFA